MDNYKLQLEKLNENEQSLFKVIDQISHISDFSFKTYFPVQNNGMSVSLYSWGGVIVSPIPLPRENNNCWSIIRQMELWKRYYRLTSPFKYDRKQRFKANITYFSKTALPFIPNPIEAHPMIDALTTILGIDDNLKKLDYSVGVEQILQGTEGCRIIVSQIDHPIYSYNVDSTHFSECESQSETSELLSHLYELEEKEIMSLYHSLLAENSKIRLGISLTDTVGSSFLRRRRKSNINGYRDQFKVHQFVISEPDSDGAFHISIDVPFRSREQLASDVFIKELDSFLNNHVQYDAVLGSPMYHLTISQKSAKPDGDNIPFERIVSVLQKENRFCLERRVDILYAPDMAPKTDLFFYPVCEKANI